MKKKFTYTTPTLEIECFSAQDIVTESLNTQDFENDNNGDYPEEW